MLRYQQQFDFFDTTKVDDAVRFVNLGDEAAGRATSDACPRAIVERGRGGRARRWSSSTRSARGAQAASGDRRRWSSRSFVQRLALHLTSWQATTFLIGEYDDARRDNPVFTVADGIIWLHQSVERNSVVRKLQVVKMRGQAPIPGLHTMRITDDGRPASSRASRAATGRRRAARDPATRRSTGRRRARRDARRRHSRGLLGARRRAVRLGQDGPRDRSSSPRARARRARRDRRLRAAARASTCTTDACGAELDDASPSGSSRSSTCGRSISRSTRRSLEIADAVQRIGAKRVVIDSLSGFELALAPTFREDFRESLYRMVGALTGLGVTVMYRRARRLVHEASVQPAGISFLTDGSSAALRRDRRAAQARDRRREDARQPAQQGVARVRDRGGRSGRPRRAVRPPA